MMALTFVLCAWGAVHPRRQWRALNGWLYRAGSEPTGVYFGWLRARNIFGGVVSGVLVVVFVVFLLRGNAGAR